MQNVESTMLSRTRLRRVNLFSILADIIIFLPTTVNTTTVLIFPYHNNIKIGLKSYIIF